jgi:hypothetical protein
MDFLWLIFMLDANWNLLMIRSVLLRASGPDKKMAMSSQCALSIFVVAPSLGPVMSGSVLRAHRNSSRPMMKRNPAMGSPYLTPACMLMAPENFLFMYILEVALWNMRLMLLVNVTPYPNFCMQRFIYFWSMLSNALVRILS